MGGIQGNLCDRAAGLQMSIDAFNVRSASMMPT